MKVHPVERSQTTKLIRFRARRAARLTPIIDREMTEKWFLLRQDALASQAETDSRWLAFYEYERYLISAIKAGAQISEGAHIPEIFMRRGGGCVVTIPRWEKEALRMKDGAVNQRSRRHIKKALGP